MAKKEYTVVHKKSNVVTNGAPKLPSASTLEYGEIAVNYGVSGETLSIRNSSDQIATFPSRGIIEGMISSEGEKYLTTATTIPTTAAEVGAMATSERGNYLVTGTTLDNVADGVTRKLSNYSTTAHTHTAAEVGAISTADTGNFLTTAATLDNVADGSTRKLSDYLTTATTIPNVDNYFDDVEYDSGTKRINFKHGETVKDYIDATDFIKDGMVDEVEIATPTGGTNSGVTCLVVTFNTDAGKEDIEIPISSIFNASNYLSTGATLDDVADGTTRKLANYSLTSHTHSEYSLTSHTHSEYATTADTANFITSAYTGFSSVDFISLSTIPPFDNSNVGTGVWSRCTSDLNRGIMPVLISNDGGDIEYFYLDSYYSNGELYFAPTVSSIWRPFVLNQNNVASDVEYSIYLRDVKVNGVDVLRTGDTVNIAVPTESTIASSGFTKNGITGITYNGTAVTVTNGVAAITGSALPTVTSADNGKVMMVVNGAWALVTPTTVYTGSNTPQNSLGNDGDIYLQTE